MMIRQSAVGSKHLCILTSDAQVRCIGDNSMNQLEYPDDLGPIVDLDAGFSHTCAVEQSGRLHCWGGNDYEQVSLTPEGLTSISLVEIGGDHSCALRRNGEVVCWGFNSQGQTSVPSQLEPSKDLAVGFYHSCALSRAGAVTCWGTIPIPNLIHRPVWESSLLSRPTVIRPVQSVSMESLSAGGAMITVS